MVLEAVHFLKLTVVAAVCSAYKGLGVLWSWVQMLVPTMIHRVASSKFHDFYKPVSSEVRLEPTSTAAGATAAAVQLVLTTLATACCLYSLWDILLSVSVAQRLLSSELRVHIRNDRRAQPHFKQAALFFALIFGRVGDKQVNLDSHIEGHQGKGTVVVCVKSE